MPLGDWVDWDKYFIEDVGSLTGVCNGVALHSWLDADRRMSIVGGSEDGRSWIPDAPVGLMLTAPPRTPNYAHVGTAFDYAMRCLLSLWNGVEMSVGIWSEVKGNPIGRMPLVAQHGCKGDKRRIKFMGSFTTKMARYFSGDCGLSAQDFVLSLLPDCVILANLESVYRSGRDSGNEDIFSVNPDDVLDLTSLVKLVNKKMWLSQSGDYASPIGFAQKKCFLNPSFGKSSLDIGGGDADIILDGCLIDIKTVKSPTRRYKDYIRQLIGYWLLNLREGDPYGITSLGIYFSRHGFLHRFPVPVINGVANCRNGKGRCCPVGWGVGDAADSIWFGIEDSIREYMDNTDSADSCPSVPSLQQRKLANTIFSTVGHEFDLSNPYQLSQVLFQELDLRPKSIRLSKHILRDILGQYHSVPAMIADYLYGKEKS